MMKNIRYLSVTSVVLLSLMAAPAASQFGGPPDMRAKMRIQAEQERRERQHEELKTATDELAKLTKVLVDEVAKVDEHTMSLQILEASDKIEDLAKKIEELAKTINRRAKGN